LIFGLLIKTFLIALPKHAKSQPFIFRIPKTSKNKTNYFFNFIQIGEKVIMRFNSEIYFKIRLLKIQILNLTGQTGYIRRVYSIKGR